MNLLVDFVYLNEKNCAIYNLLITALKPGTIHRNVYKKIVVITSENVGVKLMPVFLNLGSIQVN